MREITRILYNYWKIPFLVVLLAFLSQAVAVGQDDNAPPKKLEEGLKEKSRSANEENAGDVFAEDKDESAGKPVLGAERALKDKKKDEGWYITGQNYLKSRSRWSSDDSDWDLYNFLSLTLKDRKKDPKIKLHFDLLGLWDIDGKPKSGEDDDFKDIYDTYPDDVYARCYSAYADLYKLSPGLRARLGRQSLYRSEGLTFDGALFEQKLCSHCSWSLFGGAPVRNFKSRCGDDLLAGTKIKIKWSKRFWTGFELIRSVEEKAHADNLTDDIYFITTKYKLAKYLSLYGRLSWIDSHLPGALTKPRRHLFRASLRIPKKRIFARLMMVVQLNQLNEFTTEFSDYFATMQKFEPYTQVCGYVMKEFSDYVAVEVGCDLRELRWSESEDVLNHEFTRPYATLTFTDVFSKDGEFELTGEYWDTIDNDIFTWDASYTQKFGKKWKATLGTNFEAYDYDSIAQEEKENVRSYYLKAKCGLGEKTNLRTKFVFGEDEYDSFSRLDVALQINF
jgi:hypothetical protein